MTLIKIALNRDSIPALAVNAALKARQIGVTYGSRKVQEGLFRGALTNAVQDADYVDSFTKPESILANKIGFSQSTGTLSPLCNDIQLITPEAQISFIDAKINVVKTKVIHTQQLVGVTGSIKELIQDGDYSIDISGDVIIDNQYAFPVDDMKVLNRILSKNESVNVASVYLNEIFDIRKLVFVRGDFDQKKMKFFNVMPFTLNFQSDIDHSFLVEDIV